MPNPELINGFDINNTNTTTISAGKIADGYGNGEVLKSNELNEFLKQLFSAVNKSKLDGAWDWEAGLTYRNGALVWYNDTLWKSIAAANIGNVPVTGAFWKEPGIEDAVSLTGNQTVSGVKTFNSSPLVPTPTTGTQAVNKDYVDNTGEVIAYATSIVPNGYLECNGSEISRTTYSVLFGVIGTLYGPGDGSTTFKLPDLRGEFIRGWDNGATIDSGRVIGSTQLDSMQGHFHQKYAGVYNQGSAGGSTGGFEWPNNINNTQGGTDIVRNPISDGVNGTPRTGTETRPRNVAMMYCIKY